MTMCPQDPREEKRVHSEYLQRAVFSPSSRFCQEGVRAKRLLVMGMARIRVE